MNKLIFVLLLLLLFPSKSFAADECTFTKGDQNPPALPYSSNKLLSYFKEVSDKTGMPFAILAGIARVESTTGEYTISSYTDGDIAAMENFAKSSISNIDEKIPGTQKALCPQSPTGALGITQIEPAGKTGNDSDAINNGILMANKGGLLSGKNASSLTPQDYCDPKTSIYLASGFVLKKLKGVGIGDGTKWDSKWSSDQNVVNKVAETYYGCLKYPSCNSGPHSYGDDLWNSMKACGNTPPIATGTTTAPLTGTSESTKSASVCTKVGNPTGPAPALCKQTSQPPVGGPVQGILDWASQITNNLSRAGGYLDKLLTAITNGAYSTGTCPGNCFDSTYWCTYLVIDSYHLAGYEGLDRGAHAAVVNMRQWWKTTGIASGYRYVDYSSDPNSITQVQPGYAMFMEAVPGTHTNHEHVDLIKEIDIDSNGNGNIVTLDSNSSAISHSFPIRGYQVKNTPYPVRGFGGI